MERTDTAYQEWDRTWQTQEGRADWLSPEEDVLRILPLLHANQCRRVLDLGCGVGRHSYLLAAEGFEVTSMDRSETGLAFVEEQAAGQKLSLKTAIGEMTELPFEDESFDYVLSWNVIYHGNRQVVQQAIDEIHRVLAPAGFYQGTMLSDRHFETRIAECISEGTYVQPGPTEKAHPHYYCNEDVLKEQFNAFSFHECIETEHSKPESFHWHLLLERSH